MIARIVHSPRPRHPDHNSVRSLHSPGSLRSRRRLLRHFGLALVGLSLVLLIAACSSQPGPSKPPAAPGAAVTIATAKRGDIASSLSLTGDVRARSIVAVLPKTSGQIQRLYADVGQRVKAGDLLAELDATPLEAQSREAEGGRAGAQAKLSSMEAGPRVEQIAQAEAGLDSAQQRLATLNKGPRSELVAQAEANLRAAEARLNQLLAGPIEEQRRMARLNVEAAKVKLHAANLQKDGDCNKAKPEYLCKASEANAFAAATGVDAAEAQYDALVAPPTDDQVAQAKAAVDAAREQYKLAQNPFTEQDIAQAQNAVRVAELQLRLAQKPFTTQDLDAVRAQVAQAKAALDLARYQVDQARVLAPVAGVVAERLLAQGSLAAPTTPIISLASDDGGMVFSVDERQAAQLTIGMPVSLSVAALPGESLSSSIVSISPTVDPRTRTFLVKALAQSDKLRPGMFGQVKVQARQQRDVALVPKEAVVQRSGKSMLFVVADGRAKMAEVATGLADDKLVEITRGIEPGSQVIVSGNLDLFDNDPVTVVGERSATQ